MTRPGALFEGAPTKGFQASDPFTIEKAMKAMRMGAVNVGPLSCAKNLLVAFAPGHVEIPTTAAVIEHPKHGIVLWDTGINEAIADPERANEYWGANVHAAFGPHAFTREHVIDAQLDKLGIRPKDVRYVVYSHLHLDHAGGMSYFPDATHVVQREELRYALWPDPWTRPVYCQNDFSNIRKLKILEIEGDLDLFDDGTIRLLKDSRTYDRPSVFGSQLIKPRSYLFGRRYRPSARRI